MMNERIVAGLRCSEVLAELSDFVDGRVSAKRQGELRAHVLGCSLCERFGADFGAAVAGLRGLGTAAPLRPDVAQRLRKALADL